MLLSVAKDDGWSIRTLRIFSDEWEKMDRSLVDRERSVLLVFQFYVTGRTAHVRCPSFDEAAPPDEAKRLYEQVVASVTTPRDHCGNTGLCLRHASRVAESRTGDVLADSDKQDREALCVVAKMLVSLSASQFRPFAQVS